MSANTTGSPTLRRTARSSSQENPFEDKHGSASTVDPAAANKQSAVPLTSSKFGNQAAPKKIKIHHDSGSTSADDAQQNPMDKLLAKLSEQTAALSKQSEALKSTEDVAYARTIEYVSGASSSGQADNSGNNTPATDPNEVLRLKLELEAAKAKMARMDQELALNRTSQPPSTIGDATEYSYGPTAFYPPRPTFQRGDSSWADNDNMSDTSEALSAGGFNRARTIWQQPPGPMSYGRPGPGPAPGPRFGGNIAFPYSRGSSFDGFTPGTTAPSSGTYTPAIQQQRGPTFYPGGYHPAPIGTPLSPTAPEFTWKNDTIIATEGQTYLPTTEPLNYRRLLDRTVNCNWKYIVDKIVCNNDQQASIFLQQKLKVGTTEQKYDIVEAIVQQAYPLMVNRFGNFLVQRCFEHGTPEQVIKIAEAIRGNTLNLSMDAFGCHVVQKAFDSVPEDYKAIMVHELLRRIPETVIHRYACHVWQKLFELRWTESPPQIMKYVNEALRGMWHEVALGETGSLVVQNIFENCLEDDKRPCIEEVLQAIDIVAHGQFGNWCIQHICEHGAPADRSRAIDHVIRYASEYSMDQFASKVVEKCLKIGGIDFLGRYLDRVCEGRHDRPRIPLIDIASDQYGNYLIQYILTHSNPQHREVVAQHIRKHMVSLRGSKFGSRVGMLCTNPAIQTRPGPGVGPALGAPPARLPPTNPRFPGGYR